MAFNPEKHLIQIKNKKTGKTSDYLQVAWRLVWFRDDHPDWIIDTIILDSDAERAVFKCIISDENGVQRCAGHGSESKGDFYDYLEKAETKAVGRALAMLGYGTQFAGEELDEGERIVDSPIDRTPKMATEAQRAFILANLPPVAKARAVAKYGEGLEKMTAEDAGVTMQAMKKGAGDEGQAG